MKIKLFIILCVITFTFCISIVNATTLIIDENPNNSNNQGCIILHSISINDEGYINWKFLRYKAL